jgi:hypothetical protein
MSTLASLVSDLADELKYDPQQTVNSQLLLERNLNRALRKVQEDSGYGLPENQDVDLITLVAGTSEYALNDDFIKIGEPDSVKIDDSTPLRAVQYNDILGRTDITDQGKPICYYIRKVGTAYNIGFYPTPSSSATVTVPYLQILPDMTSVVDSPLPTDYDEALVLYSVYLTNRRIVGYEAKAQEYLAYYKELIRGIKATRLAYDRQSLRFGYQRNLRQIYSDKAIYLN